MVDQLSALQTITSKGDIKKLNHLKHIAERHHEQLTQLKQHDHPTYTKLIALLNKTETERKVSMDENTVSMDKSVRGGMPRSLFIPRT